MRIALAALSCDDSTGIGRIVRSLAREFTVAGHEAVVVAQRIENLPAGVGSVAFSPVPLSRGLSRLAFTGQTRRLFRSRRFAVVNAFGVGRGASVVTAQSCHASGVEIQNAFRRARPGRRGIGLFDAAALRDERALMTGTETQLVIAVSRLVADQLVRHYAVPAQKILVIPNGVDTERFAPDPDQATRANRRRELGFEASDFGLLFVGNEFDRKGLLTVIESVSSLGDPRVKIAVAGSDAPAPYIARAARLGVGSQVRFLGALKGPEALFSAADALVLPAWYEPFGMVIIEAMAAGLPVIATSAAGALEGFQDGTHALFLRDPLDANELADSLRKLRDDPRLRQALAASARRDIRRFSWRAVAAQTLEAYSRVSHQTETLA